MANHIQLSVFRLLISCFLLDLNILSAQITAIDSIKIKALSDSIDLYMMIEPDRALYFCQTKIDKSFSINSWNNYLYARAEKMSIYILANRLVNFSTELKSFESDLIKLKTKIPIKDYVKAEDYLHWYQVGYLLTINDKKKLEPYIINHLATIENKPTKVNQDYYNIFFDYQNLSQSYIRRESFKI